MSSTTAVASSSTQFSLNLKAISSYNPKQESDSLVLELSLSSSYNANSGDIISTDLSDLYKNLTVTGQQVIDKLNEILKAKLPNGLQSLKPEEVTSEATADNIVNGATSFFQLFADQNPTLQGEELLNKFMETIRGGIQAGYDSADKTLKDLGAYQFEGVQSGIDETKKLVEEKLVAFESFMREKLGLPTKDSQIQNQVAQNSSNSLLSQAGAVILNTAQPNSVQTN